MWSVRTYYSLLLCLLVILQDSHYVIATVRPSTIKPDPLSSSETEKSEWKLTKELIDNIDEPWLDRVDDEENNVLSKETDVLVNELTGWNYLGTTEKAVKVYNRQKRSPALIALCMIPLVYSIFCDRLCRKQEQYNDKMKNLVNTNDQADDLYRSWALEKNLVEQIIRNLERTEKLLNEAEYISEKTEAIIKDVLEYFFQYDDSSAEMNVTLTNVASFLQLSVKSYPAHDPTEAIVTLVAFGVITVIGYKLIKMAGSSSTRWSGRLSSESSRSLGGRSMGSSISGRISRITPAFIKNRLTLTNIGRIGTVLTGALCAYQIGKTISDRHKEANKLDQIINQIETHTDDINKRMKNMTDDYNFLSNIVENRTEAFTIVLNEIVDTEEVKDYVPNQYLNQYNRLVDFQNTETDDNNIIARQVELIDFLTDATRKMNENYHDMRKKALIAVDMHINLPVSSIITRLRANNIEMSSFDVYKMISEIDPERAVYDNVHLDCIRDAKIVDDASLNEYLNKPSSDSLSPFAKNMIIQFAKTKQDLSFMRNILLTVGITASDADIMKVIALSHDDALKDLEEYCPNTGSCIPLASYRQHSC